ncbi:hypothetical protein H6F90_12255 [Trichocoleus sp. FACHB-591]|uniref:hypothetical protein n=1 Tax=Trichocoleus sp. FACHB-591 TaxID=2692872 RepID=UPI0016856E1A|nr:hypothetical protein [Trichocoleus sp. FACHB-591]MBD2095920.1 hypothetical protein [Trichocoleus sp. FACHB-591]
MEEQFSPTQKQEQSYRTELVKWGIELEKAIQVARILALNISNESLTSSEVKLVEEVCNEWFEKRKQWERFQRVTAEHSPGSQQPSWENYQTATQRHEKDSPTKSDSDEKE